jgi:cellulose synthase/poly-beta-1,6-N-acetylglucosamine synthase-like glycosyltransferase
MRRLVFWTSAATVAWTFAGFPLVAWLRARFATRPYRTDPITPSVSIIVAAHNEAPVIEEKLRNLTSLDYPAECVEILIASDGSDDGTNELVHNFDDRRVRLLALDRGGKAGAVNTAAAAAGGEILVFSDANSMFAPGALRALVAPFSDPTVGGVAGDQRYLRPGAGTADAEGRYWGFDRRLKAWESAAGNVISSTGAIHAVRRELFRPVPAGLTDDFYISTGVIAAGRRLVFAADAAAYEPAAESVEAEYARKLRVATRILRTEFVLRDLMNPVRHGFYAIQFVSHKPMRQLLGIPMLLVLASSATLWRSSPFYRLALLAQSAFYGLGAVGLLRRRAPWARSRIIALPAYFCLAYAAQLLALWNVVSGRRIDAWRQQRPPLPPQHRR